MKTKDEFKTLKDATSYLKSFEEVKTIYKTTDYNQFYKFEFNRDVNHAVSIAQSMDKKDFSKDKPILVIPIKIWGTIKLAIIDGQGRLAAWMIRESPAYFYVSSYEDIYDEMIIINTGQSNWNLHNFLGHYVSRGFNNYIALNHLLARVNVGLSDVVHSLWTRGNSNIFKAGLFQMTNQLETDILMTDKLYAIIEENSGDGRLKLSRLIRACNQVQKQPRFSITRFENQFRKYGLLFSCRSTEVENAKELNRIYNIK